MIERLLIANRGEIAVRIARACRELGVESAAVYSNVDANAPHVLAADRAVPIGPAPAVESYLSIPAILQAARAAECDAVHPGYGFLSESAAFARACEEAGLVFVGPPSGVLERMGSKIEARRTMMAAGVPVVPGEMPDDQSDEGIRQAIARVGVPAFVKASAGGGGKGLRLVRDAATATHDIQAARREALAAFGDGTLFVERLIERPRHVEVQVFGDAHGHVLHLFERECSVQRRHQKVVEETPSPSIGPGLRARLTDAAVRAARAAGYRNAGTVEFLVDLSRGDREAAPFYFLEMNTRLQVEHGITELVCGVDLVHAQLRVAAGESLPWTEEEISQRGHAIEVRVYAEDPGRGFLPQSGRLLLYREPKAPGVRLDAGVVEGQTLSPHYDPLLSKIMAWGETRAMAARRLADALRRYPVLGVTTNLPFALRVLEDADFVAGNVHTGWLDARPDLVQARVPDPPAEVLAAVASHGRGNVVREVSGASQAAPDPWVTLGDWRG